jgi:ATP-dependent helicase HrpB
MISVNYYSDGRQPELAVRLQEVFGLLETPTVNNGRIKIVMHLLSPGYKPVQVTQDLKSFWGNAYTEVRKELRSRYPKHSWPEDPWTAKAVRGVKRKI